SGHGPATRLTWNRPGSGLTGPRSTGGTAGAAGTTAFGSELTTCIVGSTVRVDAVTVARPVMSLVTVSRTGNGSDGSDRRCGGADNSLGVDAWPAGFPSAALYALRPGVVPVTTRVCDHLSGPVDGRSGSGLFHRWTPLDRFNARRTLSSATKYTVCSSTMGRPMTFAPVGHCHSTAPVPAFRQ